MYCITYVLHWLIDFGDIDQQKKNCTLLEQSTNVNLDCTLMKEVDLSFGDDLISTDLFDNCKKTFIFMKYSILTQRNSKYI